MPPIQPWRAADATQEINRLGLLPNLTLSLSKHASDRMEQRDLIMGDVLYVLRRGFVHDLPQPSTQAGLFKYQIESRTPNSENRSVRLVVIPDPQRSWVKVVTVMWADE